jgi:hypothetical protein
MPEDRIVVYAVGGTGAKLAEALIHLTAAGLTDGRHWELRLVDQDQSNGNAQRTGRTFDDYRKLARQLHGRLNGTTGLLLRDCIDGDPEILGVLPKTDSSLASAFQVPARPDFERDLSAVLLHALFDAEERGDVMSNGFRARPTVGCAAFLSEQAHREAPVWQRIRADLAETGDRRVGGFLLLGSIFGGTGAAGVPTLSRYLRMATGERRPRPRIGAVLGLRYFDVQRTGREAGGGPVYGPVETARMRAALVHYAQVLAEAGGEAPIDDLFLFGLQREAELLYEPHGGGPDQANPALLAELVGALGATQFIRGATPAVDTEGRIWLSGHADPDAIGWEDLPTGTSIEDPAAVRDRRDRLLSFARFAYAYRFAFHVSENLSEIPGLAGFVSLWRHLDLEAVTARRHDAAARDLARYCEDFLKWFASLQIRRGGAANVALGGLDALLRPAMGNERAGHDEFRVRPGQIEQWTRNELQLVKVAFGGLCVNRGGASLARIVQRMATRPRAAEPGLPGFVQTLFECAQVPGSRGMLHEEI